MYTAGTEKMDPNRGHTNATNGDGNTATTSGAVV